jgi:diketogulonate reductase-like aldo/keto reductase
VPAFLYGTAWKEARTEELARLALDAGFRGIDTANQRRHYVEDAVGAAVEGALGAGALAREDLFLQTKFTSVHGQDARIPYDPAADEATQVRQSLASSLAHLGTDHVDSFVLHGPTTLRGVSATDWTVWRAMEALQREGKALLIGLSNVALDQVAAIHAGAEVKPAFVQNRCFASTGWDRELRAFCAHHGITYQGFSLLTANARELRSAVVRGVAQRTGRSAAQVVFRFALQVGMIPLTGTTSLAHMRDDLACFDFELEEAEVETLSRVSQAL